MEADTDHLIDEDVNFSPGMLEVRSNQQDVTVTSVTPQQPTTVDAPSLFDMKLQGIPVQDQSEQQDEETPVHHTPDVTESDQTLRGGTEPYSYPVRTAISVTECDLTDSRTVPEPDPDPVFATHDADYPIQPERVRFGKVKGLCMVLVSSVLYCTSIAIARQLNYITSSEFSSFQCTVSLFALSSCIFHRNTPLFVHPKKVTIQIVIFSYA